MQATEIALTREKLALNRQALLETLQAVGETDWQRPVFSEDTNWTVADLLRHLVDAEASMTRLINQIRAGSPGVPPDFDLARWNASRVAKAAGKTPEQLLEELNHNRGELLSLLGTLGLEEWKLSGRHGSLREMTVAEIAHQIADHERDHAQDIRLALESGAPKPSA